MIFFFLKRSSLILCLITSSLDLSVSVTFKLAEAFLEDACLFGIEFGGRSVISR